jgi:hypothetical protein
MSGHNRVSSLAVSCHLSQPNEAGLHGFGIFGGVRFQGEVGATGFAAVVAVRRIATYDAQALRFASFPLALIREFDRMITLGTAHVDHLSPSADYAWIVSSE